ncbi:MAG: Eukaryotic topoisomerase catalytic core [Schlesneria sp.]|nr:Eukaryotic topoisomerase catalytic core [Schlesneria sp.]
MTARSLKQARQSARRTRLLYVDDSTPGIRRQKRGQSFIYSGRNGRAIRSPQTLARINALVIPPAWTDVWICTKSNGHLQATGCDARGRKQYRYHDRWREVRDESKYQRLIEFAGVLPLIRRRVRADLRQRGLPREKVLATIVKLLEATLIRVGNEEYASANNSFGLTTLRNRHATVTGMQVHFDFKGKSGVSHKIGIRNPQLAAIVRACQDLPGQRLFQYADEENVVHEISSNDVNEYLQEISGRDFTAKDFRTWAGTKLALQSLQQLEHAASATALKKNIVQAIRSVAEQLGNTVAVCRKCYIHPAIIKAYLSDSLPAAVSAGSRASTIRLSVAERAVVKLLQGA